MKYAKNYCSDEAGSTAIEFAFIGLLAIVLCVGTVEFGRALHLANELSYAADRGTRLVLLNPGVADEDLVTEVRAHLRLANTDGLEILLSRDSIDSVRGLSISLPLTLLIPTYALDGFRVSVERKVPG